MLIYLSNDTGREVIPEEEVPEVNIMLTYFDARKPGSVQHERINRIIEVRHGQKTRNSQEGQATRRGWLGPGA